MAKVTTKRRKHLDGDDDTIFAYISDDGLPVYNVSNSNLDYYGDGMVIDKSTGVFIQTIYYLMR